MRRKFGLGISLPVVALLFTACKAYATNAACENMRLRLPPIYQQLIERLSQHMYHRDINLKITAEADVQATMKFRQQADWYDKLLVNAIREYNDGDPEARSVCWSILAEADCASYLVYQDTVINLPGINREMVLEGSRSRCENARNLKEQILK
ncbi:hypothetical protein [Magnetospirillum sp. 15-1]|uniref:hypothetical protein n=1 Tax=Magnetospirillum sp. 15-1 TaxID=1979370 RepID=UPI001144C343|nr:hypothetical protein [Magnetospirillum sp. 15-1]